MPILVALSLPTSVEANWSNCSGLKPYMACGMESLAGYFKTGFGPYLQALTFHFCGFWHTAGHINK